MAAKRKMSVLLAKVIDLVIFGDLMNGFARTMTREWKSLLKFGTHGFHLSSAFNGFVS